MATTKQLKSLNLDLDDHELAGRIADFQNRRWKNQAEKNNTGFMPKPATIKSAVHDGLVRLAKDLGIIE